MSNALEIAATGMQAQQTNVEIIAHNLSNVNTAGFKKSTVHFVDQMVRTMLSGLKASPAWSGDGAERAELTSGRGAGVGIVSVSRSFENGELKITDSPFDLAIRGDGFLEVIQPDGSVAYWRAGTFKRNSDGLLSTLSGQTLRPGFSIPADAQNISIASDGRVQVTVPGQSAPTELGQLQLTRFASPGLLEAIGDNLYRVTDLSGDGETSRPGEGGVGTFVQGRIEASNVNLVDGMVSLMLAQRAYEASLKVMQTADEMAALSNNLRK